MKEIRSLEEAEFRTIPETRTISGYALIFNQESQDLGGFVEIIDRNALDGVLEKSDILALYNHMEDKVLARSTNLQGTLSLEIDQRGLKYRFQAPNTTLGNEVLDAIQRGDLRNSSFDFTTNENGVKWERRGDKYVRNIKQFDMLYDVSPVFRPAYTQTSVDARSLEQIKKEFEPEDIKIEPIVEPIMINIRYNDNEYTVPLEPIKNIIDETDNERDLNIYIQELENQVQSIKK